MIWNKRNLLVRHTVHMSLSYLRLSAFFIISFFFNPKYMLLPKFIRMLYVKNKTNEKKRFS